MNTPAFTIALLLAIAGASAQQPSLKPVEKPPFDPKMPTIADKNKMQRESSQKRYDDLLAKWDAGYDVPGKGKPVLKFEKPVQNLGRVSDDGMINLSYKFKNTSDQTVKITGVKPSCGCTTPKLDKDTYGPGEEGEIKATFNPQNRHGLEFKEIDVSFESKEIPAVKIAFLVDTAPRVVLEPPAVSLGEVRKNSPAKQIVSVVGRESGFDVTSVTMADPSAPFTVTRLDRVEEPDGVGGTTTRVRFEVAMQPRETLANFNTSASFTTTDPVRSKVTATINAMVVGDVRTMPDRVFVAGAAGMNFAREVKVEHRNAQPFHVLGVSSEGMTGGLSAVFDLAPSDTTAAGDQVRSYTIKVSGTLPASGNSLGKIVVLTDIPDQPRIEIPLQGVIANVGAPVAPSITPAVTPVQK